jgi:hypothetical protein
MYSLPRFFIFGFGFLIVGLLSATRGTGFRGVRMRRFSILNLPVMGGEYSMFAVSGNSYTHHHLFSGTMIPFDLAGGKAVKRTRSEYEASQSNG